ncbi:MAG: glutathione S-transferase family protein [Komarekiella atlantica HA4396-MV6]|jgi:glutathione S-transferase|nr:glutathione S-transferase family protein [Komarekiella atlantica HA4396-MV6]
MLELYYFPGSLCSQKVKLVLAEKNLKWSDRLINLLTFENLQPSYIYLNPKGVVPTLVHDGKIICDSATIIRYLDEQFPNPSLIPNELVLQKSMDAWVDLQNHFPMREVMYGNYKGIDGIVLQRSVQIKEKLIPQLMQANPELKERYAAKLEDVKQWNQTIRDSKKIADINARIEPLLEQLEQQLSQTKWLCGETYSLADVVWTAVLNRLNELNFGYLWKDNSKSAIARYFQCLKERPSFQAAIQQDKMPLFMITAGLRRIFLDF